MSLSTFNSNALVLALRRSVLGFVGLRKRPLSSLCTVSRGSGAHLAPEKEVCRRVHGRCPRPHREAVPAARHLRNAIGAEPQRRGRARSPGRRALAATHTHPNRPDARRSRRWTLQVSRDLRRCSELEKTNVLPMQEGSHIKHPREGFRRERQSELKSRLLASVALVHPLSGFPPCLKNRESLALTSPGE